MAGWLAVWLAGWMDGWMSTAESEYAVEPVVVAAMQAQEPNQHAAKGKQPNESVMLRKYFKAVHMRLGRRQKTEDQRQRARTRGKRTRRTRGGGGGGRGRRERRERKGKIG